MELASCNDCLHCSRVHNCKICYDVKCYNDIHVLFYRNVILAGKLVSNYVTNAKLP